MDLNGVWRRNYSLHTQRVQLECHYGIKAHKTIHGIGFGT